MFPAAEVMEEALSNVDVSPPIIPLIANVTAAPVEEPGIICRLLVEQVTNMVRWRECVLAMKEIDVDTLVEIGSGKVLSGLVRRIDPDLSAIAISDPAGVEAFLKTI